MGLEMVSIGGLEQGWKFIPPKCSDVGTGLGGSGVVDLFCYVGYHGTVFMDDGSVEINENGFGPGGAPFSKCTVALLSEIRILYQASFFTSFVSTSASQSPILRNITNKII